jgi:putative membrane protein
MRATGRGLLVVFGVLLLVVLLVPVAMGGMMGAGVMGPGMMPGIMIGSGPGGWAWGLGMGLGWLMMLAFWGVLILGIALGVGYLRAGQRETTNETPLEILRRRYAAGELTGEQFEQMRQALEGAR